MGDLRHHGGDHQAVYAFAREDLTAWEKELGRELSNGVFGENLTTSGLDVNGASIGERWRIGASLVLEVTSPRIPCRTFAGWLAEKGWVKRFTQAARPGAYLRVIEPGEIKAGDDIEVVSRPEHGVTVELFFRALTTEPDLLPRVLDAGDALNPPTRRACAGGWSAGSASGHSLDHGPGLRRRRTGEGGARRGEDPGTPVAVVARVWAPGRRRGPLSAVVAWQPPVIAWQPPSVTLRCHTHDHEETLAGRPGP